MPTKIKPDTDVRRVTIKLTPDAYDSVRSMADGLEMSLTSLIRQALAVFRFFFVEHKDAKVFLKEGDGELREVVLFNGR
jgi:hypothetical protein